jgi:hypothetical protein
VGDTSGIQQVKRPRLLFIDMARSFAILLMIEGHFTGAGLASQYKNDDYFLYKIWHNLHGLTSPLFFTVTGLIFVYLLMGTKSEEPFFQNSRVKKGFKRVSELLFWGYLIQLNSFDIISSFLNHSEFHLEWLYAFHVLQSIGVGISLLLLIYGIRLFIKKGEIYWYYLIAGLIVMVLYSQLKAFVQADELRIAGVANGQPHYLPSGFPEIIQNMFYGRYSDFNILRYVGYVLLGGMVGAIIRKYETKTKNWWFGLTFIIVGIALNGLQPLLYEIDDAIEWLGLCQHSHLVLTTTSFGRYGQVVSIVGALMLVDANFKVNAPLFLKLGQNTLPIYVIHVIVLYGGIFGFGLKPDVINNNLNPYAAFSVSIMAMLFFTIMVKYIEPLEEFYDKCLSYLFFWRKKV